MLRLLSYLKSAWQFRHGAAYSARTRRLAQFDLERLRVRRRREGLDPSPPARSRLHFGCGSHRIQGWPTVDLRGSDDDVHLAPGQLPWPDGALGPGVGLQVIEHCVPTTELLPLLR